MDDDRTEGVRAVAVRPGLVFAWLFVGSTAASYGVFLLALLALLVTEGLGFTEVFLGAAMAALDLGGFASPFVAGMFADRAGPKPISLVGLGCVSVGAILCGLAPGLVAFIVGQFLLGAGLAMFGVMAYAWINETLGERKGLYLGVYVMSIALGLGLAGVTIAVLLPIVPDWRTYYLLAGALALVPTAALAVFLPRGMGVPLRTKDLRKALRNRDVRWIAGLQFLVGFGWSAYSWLPLFLAQTRGVDLRLAVLLFVGSAAIWALSGVWFGRIADRGWARTVIVVGGLATAVAYAGVFAFGDLILAAASLFVFAFFWPAGSLVSITFLGQRLGPNAQRTEVGLQENLFLLGEGLGAALVGLLAVTLGLTGALILVSTSGTLAAALLFFVAFGIGRDGATPVTSGGNTHE
jgi:predicted MFS family arabinose efflux permease